MTQPSTSSNSDSVPFRLIRPQGDRLVPILLSSPHSGVEFPELQTIPKNAFIKRPPDTDWFIDELYEFAPKIGITVISACFSRYVVDLNRSADTERNLYTDRAVTAVVPTASFDGLELYEGSPPSDEEVRERVARFHEPYHRAIAQHLDELKSRFGRVLLFDAHSIRRSVPTISPRPFPDLIVGTRDGGSCAKEISEALFSSLRGGGYEVSSNSPFKGGEITRSFGKPDQNQHALQLEMSQDVYMDENDRSLDAERASKIRSTLEGALVRLSEVLAG